MQNQIDGQHVDALMQQWTCGQVSCKNERGYCYVLEGVHLKLLVQHLKTWSMEWNLDKADVDTPSRSLVMSLMPSKQGAKHPWRPGVDASTPNASNTPAAPPPLPAPFMGYPYPFYGFPGLQQFAPLQPGLPPPLSQPLHPSTPVQGAPDVSNRSPCHSSSPSSEIDPTVDKLTEYFTWLSKLHPTKAEQLTGCLTMFRANDIVLGTIRDVDKEIYVEWGISIGLRLLLTSHLKKWERAKAKGRA
jgi:hypothetical protein